MWHLRASGELAERGAGRPVWDMLMGSFHNPERFEGEVGFEPAAARRVGAMLVGVDVNAGAAAGLETAASL